MATQSFNVNADKVKLKYRERYITEGSNEKALAFPRGCYRGFVPWESLVPDTKIRLRVDPFAYGMDEDSFAVYSEYNDGAPNYDGWAVSIRETQEVELDLAGSALMPAGQVLPGASYFYIYITAVYNVGSATEVTYTVSEEDPYDVASSNYNPRVIMIGRIPVTPGAVAIAFDMTDASVRADVYAVRKYPAPTAVQDLADLEVGDARWGYLDSLGAWCLGTGDAARLFAEPTVESIVCAAPTTKFQLSGTYYIGNGVIGSAKKFFRLMDDSTTTLRPLVGTDGGWLHVDVVYQTDGLTQITPSADADSNGFYEDPWLEIGFWDTSDANFTGTLQLLSYKRKTLLTLENDPASAFPDGDIEVASHAANVRARALSGSPSSLVSGSLESQLSSLLLKVNARIETIHNEGAPADWVLLWRSHDISVDANVTKSTCSLYFGALGFAYIVGGYISTVTGNVVAGTGAATSDVAAMVIKSGTYATIINAMKEDPAAGSSWDIDTGWDSYVEQTGSLISTVGVPFSPRQGVYWLPESLSTDAFSTFFPGDSSSVEYVKREEVMGGVWAGVPRFRRYVSNVGTIFTSNCYLDSSDDWVADSDSFDAIKVQVTSLGFRVYKKHSDDISGTTPWADSAWTTTWKIGESDGSSTASLACMEVEGETYEEIKFGWCGQNGATLAINVSAECNYRNKISPNPTSGDFTFPAAIQNSDGAGGSFSLSGASLDTIGEWGFSVIANAPVSSATLGYIYRGSVIVENV